MPRLLVNPGSAAAWEIELRPGPNSLGRSAANDFKIDDPSVSGSHCEILVGEESAVIRDLGSTNGTFVNRAPVQEALLQPGQTVHLGGVQMVFEDESSVPVAAAVEAPPPVLSAPRSPASAVPTLTAQGQYCKFHPKTPARLFCAQCNHYFCELCVTSRTTGGVPRKLCRHCGAECTPVQVHLQQAAPAGFYSRLPGAFIYPFRGAGVLVLIVGMLLFAAFRFGASTFGFGSLRLKMFGLILQVFAGGYFFAYLQNILHSTAAEDNEMPDLPSMANFYEDILMPCLRLLGLLLICFGPVIVVGVLSALTQQPALALAVVPIAILGTLYFPMAFLAVAILDSVAAANPLVVVPSILKVPVEYVITLILLAGVFGFRALGDAIMLVMFGDTGMTTDSMGRLFLLLGSKVFWSFISLYLLTVTMRILGLLYLTRKHKLGWLDR